MKFTVTTMRSECLHGPLSMLIGSYNPLLVLCSLLVAMLASYTALGMASRIFSTNGAAARWWIGGGGTTMGIGIWSMHFVGMLAYRLPIPLGYDVGYTVASLFFAMASSTFALWLVSQATLKWPHLCAGAVLMGSGIAGMHYVGMGAMRMSPPILYNPYWVALSILVAIVASGAGLWIAFRLRRESSRNHRNRVWAAMMIGVSIAGMHYTGMAAAEFSMGSICLAADSRINLTWLAALVIVFSLVVLAFSLVISMLDLRFERRVTRLSTSLDEANRDITFHAWHDRLTNLPNRAALEKRIDQAIKAADQGGHRVALILLRLDNFKRLNDLWGNQAVDVIVLEVTKRILGLSRPNETVARIAAEDFIMLATIEVPEDAAARADSLVQLMQRPFSVDGKQPWVSNRISIAVYPDDGAHRRDLLNNVKAAMQHALTVRKEGYSFFETSMSAAAKKSIALVHDLRLAMDRGELRLHYQPKVSALTGETVGAEALLRWPHPVRGNVPPDEFIPVAERTGLILPIGQWVLDQACRQLRAWQEAGHSDWGMAVNLSPLQFEDPTLVAMLGEMLKRYSLVPRLLTVEITEAMVMRDVATTLAMLQALDQMGVRISIDDFGTGHSSLLYLKRFPACELKIDRGFIRDLGAGGEDEAIVAAIVALGKALRLKIVAEGVETSGQRNVLTDMGCDVLQGYYFGRPVPAENFPGTGHGANAGG